MSSAEIPLGMLTSGCPRGDDPQGAGTAHADPVGGSVAGAPTAGVSSLVTPAIATSGATSAQASGAGCCCDDAAPAAVLVGWKAGRAAPRSEAPPLPSRGGMLSALIRRTRPGIGGRPSSCCKCCGASAGCVLGAAPLPSPSRGPAAATPANGVVTVGPTECMPSPSPCARRRSRKGFMRGMKHSL
eukprot:364462-Chlamydomonas_euryale.AAC.2